VTAFLLWPLAFAELGPRILRTTIHALTRAVTPKGAPCS
jgi:hypothetical protein